MDKMTVNGRRIDVAIQIVFINVGTVEDLKTHVVSFCRGDWLEKIVDEIRTVNVTDKRSTSLLLRADRGAVSIDRREDQKARLVRLILRLLDQFHFSRRSRRCRIASSLHGLSAYRIRIHFVADGGFVSICFGL